MAQMIFKTSLLATIVICGLIRLPFMKKCRNKVKLKSVNEFFERTKCFIAWLGMVFVPSLWIFTPLLNNFSIRLPISLRIAAVAALIANAGFFYAIHKTLDDNWSAVLEIKDGQKLVTSGVYKYVRHPMYTQCWIWVLLQGIIAANLFVEIFGILSWGFLYFTRVFSEEKMMIEQFGEEYKKYMKHTGRLLPKFSVK